jgi:hypothetical protein
MNAFYVSHFLCKNAFLNISILVIGVFIYVCRFEILPSACELILF